MGQPGHQCRRPAVLRYGNTRDLALPWKWCCPMAAYGAACAGCARTTPAMTSAPVHRLRRHAGHLTGAVLVAPRPGRAAGGADSPAAVVSLLRACGLRRAPDRLQICPPQRTWCGRTSAARPAHRTATTPPRIGGIVGRRPEDRLIARTSLARPGGWDRADAAIAASGAQAQSIGACGHLPGRRCARQGGQARYRPAGLAPLRSGRARCRVPGCPSPRPAGWPSSVVAAPLPHRALTVGAAAS